MKAANANEQLQKVLQGMKTKVGDTWISIYDLFNMSAQELQNTEIKATDYQNLVDTFYKLVNSKDFDANNPLTQANLDLIAQSGLNLEYKLPDGNTITIIDGDWIVTTTPGQYVVGTGKDKKVFTDAKQAMTYRNQLESTQAFEEFKRGDKRDKQKLQVTDNTKDNGINITTKGLHFHVSSDPDAKGFIMDNKHYDTWADVQQGMVDIYNDKLAEAGQTTLTTKQARIALGLDVVPKVQFASDLTPQQLMQLKKDGMSTWQDIVDKSSQMGEEFQIKYGFKPAQNVSKATEAEINQALDDVDVKLTADITADGKSVVINGPVQAVLEITDFQLSSGLQLKLAAQNFAAQFQPSVPQQNPDYDPNARQGALTPPNETSPMNDVLDGLTKGAEDCGRSLTEMGAQGQNFFEILWGKAVEWWNQLINPNSPDNKSTNQSDNKEQSGQKIQEKIQQTSETFSQNMTSLQESFSSALTNIATILGDLFSLTKKDSDNKDKPSESGQSGQSGDTGKTNAITAISESLAAVVVSFQQIVSSTVQASEGVQSAIANVGESLDNLKDAASAAASGASQAATAIKQSYANVPSGAKSLDLTVNVKVNGESESKGTVTGWSPTSVSVNSLAKGNIALAGGTRKTLMGELGPELVVSNGGYYVVGQSGAEMVDLEDDAIVFNHLQTKRLLSNGHTSRGTPITNQRNAVSWATGNANGPAMASASAVSAALKQIRAMWQAMLNASMKDLGALAGNEGGGGGGGGGKEPPQLKAILNDIERWYNLVRQIDSIQQDITYQETLQNKLQSDRIANGKALYESYKKQIELLDQEIVRNQQLADLQKSWYELRLDEFTESDYGRFYTYDRDTGLMQLKDGFDQGMDALFKLNEKGVYGQTTGAATNAKTQIEYLKSIGFDTKHLMYNGDGTVIDPKAKEYKDNPDKVYEDMMNNFWDNLDGWKQQLDSLYDEYRDQLNAVLQNEDKRNQLLQTIVDNQLSVEQDVLKAIESRQQKLIDELQKQRDAFEESTKDFIDGLNDQLKEQRKMYQNEENEKELVKLRRQVSILQRSGGSASQIRSLQQQIAAKEQDQYFNSQEQQIAAIQKASDLQLKRLDAQIKLMTETLDYQKENGLLWEEVYQIMAGTPQQIRQFIMQNTPDFQSASALDVAEKIRDIDLRINEWTSYRDDENAPNTGEDNYYDWNSFSQSRQWKYGESIWETEQGEQAKAEFDRVLHETGDINAAGRAADAIIDALIAQLSQEDLAALGIHAPRTPETEEEGTVPTVTGDPRLDALLAKYKNKPRSTGNPNATAIEVMRQPIGKPSTGTKSTPKQTSNDNSPEQQALIKEMENLQSSVSQMGYTSGNLTFAQMQFNQDYDKLTEENKKKFKGKYAKGGLVNYTGLAQVDGTPSRPQAFLNAEQTALLRDKLFGIKFSLIICETTSVAITWNILQL